MWRVTNLMPVVALFALVMSSSILQASSKHPTTASNSVFDTASIFPDGSCGKFVILVLGDGFDLAGVGYSQYDLIYPRYNLIIFF